MYPSPNTVWWPESFSSPVGCIHTQGLISWPPDRAMCCQRRNPPTQGSFSCLCSFLPRLLAHAWIPPTQTLTHAATCLDLHPRPLPDFPSISSPCHPSPTQDSVFPPWPPSPIIPSSGHTTAHLEEEPPSPPTGSPPNTHPPIPCGRMHPIYLVSLTTSQLFLWLAPEKDTQTPQDLSLCGLHERLLTHLN